MTSAPPSFAWPPGFDPPHAALHVHNELQIDASPERVWAWLVRAPLWPVWYPYARNVRLPLGEGTLTATSAWTWTTGGIPLRSQVREYEEGRRIAWDALNPFLQAYHGWTIEPNRTGCFVITEETHRGILPRVFTGIVRARMLRMHQTWLERLRRQSRTAPRNPT